MARPRKEGMADMLAEMWGNCISADDRAKVEVMDLRVKESLTDMTRRVLMLCAWAAIEATTPIEQVMAVYLQGLAMWQLAECQFSISYQYPVITEERTYHVDMMVIAERNGRKAQIAVECDGHDFHEKTKQQVALDKQRERHIKAAGYDLLRFTGSEIWGKPVDCASEVLRFVRNKLDGRDK